jgi:hypothetical protein
MSCTLRTGAVTARPTRSKISSPIAGDRGVTRFYLTLATAISRHAPSRAA